MNIRDLIPEDKYDVESVTRLSRCQLNDIKEILPEVFEWLTDINWPVAQELTNILPKFGKGLLPHIETALKSSDPQWQFSMLQFLIRELPKEISLNLVPLIQRIADEPSQLEILEELDILAKETLKVIITD